FGRQPKLKVAKTIGEYTSNKKTNAFNKSDQEACDIAFISAAVSLQQRAKQEGGNAVVNIHSVYKNDKFESPTEYLCGAGALMAGVALRGTVVTLGE
ncbi:MAG TPA: excinuclease ABC subunit A, partial [Burkholderiales bacterium]|nr:excinuclease ABC subunit A [Burkholderiales bacterium]